MRVFHSFDFNRLSFDYTESITAFIWFYIIDYIWLIFSLDFTLLFIRLHTFSDSHGYLLDYTLSITCAHLTTPICSFIHMMHIRYITSVIHSPKDLPRSFSRSKTRFLWRDPLPIQLLTQYDLPWKQKK